MTPNRLVDPGEDKLPSNEIIWRKPAAYPGGSQIRVQAVGNVLIFVRTGKEATGVVEKPYRIHKRAHGRNEALRNTSSFEKGEGKLAA
jgi:hypothetical protein